MNASLHNTHYTLAQLRAVILPLAQAAIFVGGYWLVVGVGRCPIRMPLVWTQTGLWILAVICLRFPYWISTLEIRTRSYIDYPDLFEVLGTIESLGYFATLISALLFVICIGEAIYRRYAIRTVP